MDESTAALVGGDKQMLPSHFQSYLAAQQAIESCRSTLPEWQAANKGVAAPALAGSLMQEHRTCVEPLVAFVQAAQARLNSLQLEPLLPAHAAEMERLHGTMFTPILTYHQLLHLWPTACHIVHNPQLFAALNVLATLLCSAPARLAGKAHPYVSLAVDGTDTPPALSLLTATVTCFG